VCRNDLLAWSVRPCRFRPSHTTSGRCQPSRNRQKQTGMSQLLCGSDVLAPWTVRMSFRGSRCFAGGQYHCRAGRICLRFVFKTGWRAFQLMQRVTWL
jgi:hypothetical protein